MLKLAFCKPSHWRVCQPPSGGCVLKQIKRRQVVGLAVQPPSGGCVLKRQVYHRQRPKLSQPPSGGCVLNRISPPYRSINLAQPPSGGCVLKHEECVSDVLVEYPAAFRRLCVETVFEIDLCQPTFPAAFRRLCVETLSTNHR